MRWVRVAGIAALLVPVAVLSHEAGHLAGYFAFNFPLPVLHYGSAGFQGEPDFWIAIRAGDLEAARQVGDIWAAGVSALWGLLVSYSLIVIGLAGLHFRGSVVLASLAVATAARFPLILLLVTLGRAEHTDEAHVTQALGVPFAIMAILAGVFLVASVVGVYQIQKSAEREPVTTTIVAGVVLGVVAWMAWLGPLILP